MPMQPVFDIQEISFTYEGKQTAIDGVSLRIDQGECVVILGSNGCGKSTLLKLLDGLYFPEKGQVFYRGQALSEDALRDDEFNFRFRRQVGLVFQDSDVQLFMPSVLDEIAFAPLQLGLPAGEVNQRVEEALQALRIEKLRLRAPHRLSGGEKRRVALASLFSLRPEVWLLDEPTTGLDPRSQDWLVQFILAQRAAGHTVITATHDLNLAEQIASRIVVFNEEHRLAADGSPDAILCDHELLHRCNLEHFHPPERMGALR